MFITRKIKVGNKYIQALSLRLLDKNLIVLRGSKGYVMCGYLDMKVAERFSDVAVTVVNVATIAQAINARVHVCTSSARRLGIHKGQPIKEVLRIIG